MKRNRVYIALLLLVVAGGIGAGEYQRSKIDGFSPDGVYIDTLLQDHSRLQPITSDTATPETKRIYDSLVKAQEAADSATTAKGSKFKSFSFSGKPLYFNGIEDEDIVHYYDYEFLGHGGIKIDFEDIKYRHRKDDSAFQIIFNNDTIATKKVDGPWILINPAKVKLAEHILTHYRDSVNDAAIKQQQDSL